jgi:hypothetical protein
MYWNFKPLNTNRERIRAQAEAFASEIGVENVVSVTEHAMSFGPFSVVVWYRAAQDAEPSAAPYRVKSLVGVAPIAPSRQVSLAVRKLS